MFAPGGLPSDDSDPEGWIFLFYHHTINGFFSLRLAIALHIS